MGNYIKIQAYLLKQILEQKESLKFGSVKFAGEETIIAIGKCSVHMIPEKYFVLDYGKCVKEYGVKHIEAGEFDEIFQTEGDYERKDADISRS